ncbi:MULTISPECIES: lipopolysaccharide transport periplasmic protein LptA [unclassified Roseateles]|uniref:lipopolysaccharide transport periplasmic protein LptA n=1 Tax=unclassified Roseateles TaxID=2626991 RepID=UPI00138ECD4C|nr:MULTISPECIES: lipopolysaccharide transport periplasmic protein LptA [unclassified Roseateles]
MHRLLIPLALVLALPAAQAEKADRLKPMIFTAEKQGRIDSVNQRTELLGNVIITKGSLLLKAEKVDVRETRDGYHQAYASGTSGQPVSFRQARDIPGEAVDGVADQVEYDTKTETVRFIGNATVRRLRGTAVAEEVTGAVIVYDSRTEVFTLEGGSASPNPNGRTRIVLMPRAQPGDEAASAPTAPLPLKPSTTLQPGKPS